MRRKDKCILKGAATGFLFTCLSDIALQWIELKNINQNFTWVNYNCSRTLKRSIFGAAVGAGLGYSTFKCNIS